MNLNTISSCRLFAGIYLCANDEVIEIKLATYCFIIFFQIDHVSCVSRIQSDSYDDLYKGIEHLKCLSDMFY